MNQEIKYALDYHQETKHSQMSIRLSNHYLDWDNKPKSFKFYTNIPSIALPTDFPLPKLNVITMKETNHVTALEISKINTELLSSLLFFSSGITRQMKFPHGKYYMRAAPATGALYPIEVYIVSENINGLQAGVYHFCPGEFSLTRLREGDYRQFLSEAAGFEPAILNSPFTFILSSIAWRNAWKYQARSYRHWFWDSGVIAANLIATATSFGLNTRLITGYIDKFVNELLSLEEYKEASIILAPIGIGLSKQKPSKIQYPSRFVPEIVPISTGNEVVYEQIWKLHDASSLNSTDDVCRWNRSVISMEETEEVKDDHVKSFSKHIEPRPNNTQSLSDVILLRGSTRKFSREPITFEQLSNILYSLAGSTPSDFGERKSFMDVYFIANDVNKIQKGAYFFNRNNNSIDLLKPNIPRDMSGYLCLEQTLFSDASVVFYIMSNIKSILYKLGDRGYRLCQFEAGILAGRIYLSAYNQKIGASGSTFYDDAVADFFSPHAKGKDVMIAVGIGVPGYRSKSGKVLAGKFSRNELLS